MYYSEFTMQEEEYKNEQNSKKFVVCARNKLTDGLANPISCGHSRPKHRSFEKNLDGPFFQKIMHNIPTMHPNVEAFLDMLVAERGVSSNTLEAYGRDLSDFCNFVGSKPIEAVQADDIREFLVDLDKRQLNPATKARRLSALRQFFLFLLSEGIIDHNPVHTIDSPKLGRPLPKVLTEDEVTALLDAAHEYTEPEGVRLVALLELLYATGMRVSEIVSLPLSAIVAGSGNTIRPTIIVRGKGGRERAIPVGTLAIEALREYCKVRPIFENGPHTEQWLFPSRSKNGHLTRQRFAQLLKSLAIDANVDHAKVSPHALRHAFATHLLNNGADLLSVQKMLGHADITTTEIYTHVMGDRLQEVVNLHHPLAKVNS